MIQCRFSEFLIQVCMKNAFFGVPCRNITTMCRNIAFIEVRAEILLTWDQGVPGFSFRAIFGVREEILIFGEIFTSALTQPNTVVLHASHGK